MTTQMLARDPADGHEYDVAEAARQLAFSRWRLFKLQQRLDEEEPSDAEPATATLPLPWVPGPGSTGIPVPEPREEARS